MGISSCPLTPISPHSLCPQGVVDSVYKYMYLYACMFVGSYPHRVYMAWYIPLFGAFVVGLVSLVSPFVIHRRASPWFSQPLLSPPWKYNPWNVGGKSGGSHMCFVAIFDCHCRAALLLKPSCVCIVCCTAIINWLYFQVFVLREDLSSVVKIERATLH